MCQIAASGLCVSCAYVCISINVLITEYLQGLACLQYVKPAGLCVFVVQGKLKVAKVKAKSLVL